VVRYSFLVGLFHSLLHAGLARRTAWTISHKKAPRTEPPETASPDCVLRLGCSS
jgi:hypothetical protein